MKRVVHIIDSLQYVRDNCFQHQLADGLARACSLWSVSLQDLVRDPTALDGCDVVISCLRMRSLDQHRAEIGACLNGRQVVVYDQDPWESFKFDGACNGAYARVVDAMSVSSFAVTTHAWENRLRRLGFPSRFVRMGMLPRYCAGSPGWHERPVDVGFVGQLHPYRLELFQALRDKGVRVELLSGGGYQRYLAALSRIKVFVHREAGEHDIAGERVQYAEGLWAKDVEAISQGCVSVRNWHQDACLHMPPELVGTGLRMFDDGAIDDAVCHIKGALAAHASMPTQAAHERAWCTRLVAQDDAWLETARTLIGT
jgi:hypothetical protein